MGFYEDVRAASYRYETKADIVRFYQQQYPSRGKGGWKQKLVHDLLPFTPQTGKNPAKNLEKRFDPQRLHNPEPRNKAQYEALSQTLPVHAPDNGYHIHGIIYVKYSDGECEEREVDEVIAGEDAEKLAAAASEDILQKLVNYYQNEDMNEPEPTASVGDCHAPQLEIEAL